MFSIIYYIQNLYLLQNCPKKYSRRRKSSLLKLSYHLLSLSLISFINFPIFYTFCFQQRCPSFGLWSPWGPCSASCGRGSYQRRRECKYGVISDDGCVGEITDFAFCNTQVRLFLICFLFM